MFVCLIDQPVQCPKPRLIDHGDLLLTDRTEDSILSYTCDEGFMMFGNKTRQCTHEGNWTGIEPICWSKLYIYIDRL